MCRGRRMSRPCRSSRTATTAPIREEKCDERHALHQGPRMGPPGGRNLRDRHHRLRAVAARRRGLCRIARDRPPGRAGQGSRNRRIGQGGERGLCAGVGRGRRGQRRDRRRSGAGQCRRDGRGLVHQAAARRCRAARRADGPGGLRRLCRRAGAALMRYLPLTDSDRREMLATIGAPSIDGLFADVPAAARHEGLLDLPLAMGEIEVARLLGAMAAKNTSAGAVPCFLGGGAYRHHIPAAVDHLVQRGEFLTSYTPYQPEVAQGTLQYLFEFQTQVALLTGMEVANASLYDGATACAEAVAMAGRVTRRHKAVLSGGLNPQYRAVCETYAKFAGNLLLAQDPAPGGGEDLAALVDADTACVVVQNPDFYGEIRDYSALAERCHQEGALLVVVVTEILSLGAITPPGEMGADIVAAEGQSFGSALNFGGPYVGLFASREKFVRQMPGRLVGETLDAAGRRGWVLTLSTREQHIRREKATSNICTNSGLCSLAFTIHLALLGEAGLVRLARLNHATAAATAERLAAIPGVQLLNGSFFNEFALLLPRPAAPVVEALAKRGVLGGIPLSRFYPERPELADLLLVAATEMVTPEDIDRLDAGLREA